MPNVVRMRSTRWTRGLAFLLLVGALVSLLFLACACVKPLLHAEPLLQVYAVLADDAAHVLDLSDVLHIDLHDHLEHAMVSVSAVDGGIIERGFELRHRLVELGRSDGVLEGLSCHLQLSVGVHLQDLGVLHLEPEALRAAAHLSE